MPNISKEKRLTYQAQLKNLGIELTKLKGQLRATRSRERYDDYCLLLRDLDMQQNCNKYKWKGLPNNITSWLIEQMLYYRGSLAGFFNGGQLKILPYTNTGGINIYGLPNKVQPIAYNGASLSPTHNENTSSFGEELIISNYGEFNPDAKAVLLYDRIPAFTGTTPISRFLLNDALIDLQADILARIKINLINSTTKGVFTVDNEKQAVQMRADLENALGTSSPFVITVKEALSNIDGKPFQTGIEIETQALFEAWQSVNSIRCMVSGIRNGGAFEKKERQITVETQNDDVQTDTITDIGLEMRKLFISQLKIQFGAEYGDIVNKISVELNDIVQPVNNNIDGRFTNGDENNELSNDK